MSFVQVMDAEIADLERKLAAVRAARAAYVGVVHEKTSIPTVVGVGAPSPIRVGTYSPPSGRRTEQSAVILQKARELIESTVEPVPTAAILSTLIAQGIDVRGANPQNALSALLSNANIFQANGRAGWTLRRDPTSKNTEAADATIPSQDASAASFEPRFTSEDTPQRGQDEPRPGGGT